MTLRAASPSSPARKGPGPALVPGLSVTAAVAGLAFLLRELPGFGLFSPLILAILVGVALRNIFGLSPGLVPGATFAVRRLLRVGIVLLGLQLTLGQVAQMGMGGAIVVAASLGGTYLFTIALGRLLGVAPGLTRLIAAGTSICGASAVIAANAVTRAPDEDLAYAIATVTIFGTVAMFLDPLLGQALGLGARAYGLWVGASIHEVAQVVAAGAQGGAEAGGFATITKLSRVALLAPMIMMMAKAGGGTGARAPFPWFVIGFLAMVLIASSGALPPAAAKVSAPVTQTLLAMALAAMGLQTDIGRLRAKGLRPLALAAAASVVIAALSLALVFATTGL